MVQDLRDHAAGDQRFSAFLSHLLAVFGPNARCGCRRARVASGPDC